MRRPSAATALACLAAATAGIALAPIALAGTAAAAPALPTTPAPSPAPLRGAGRPGVVPGRYVVVLKTAAAGGSDSQAAVTDAVADARQGGATVYRRYRNAIHGYAAAMTQQQVQAARRDPAVAFVEADRVISSEGSRSTASWGQDRIDARSGLDGHLSTVGDGTGVTAYVIDTGIRSTHTDLGGRVSSGYTAISDGNGTEDCNGHGTHVAGTVGSNTYGVAPGVQLVAVRVLGCNGSGTSSGVIAGIDWVTAHHAANSVANMSLGGSAYSALDHAVADSIAAGVTYAVAAGNDTADACGTSPARLPEAITVGASTSSDGVAGFSNYGSCVDLYAPGQGITSTVSSSDTATATYSGTSMATPHVTGAAALYLQAHPGSTPAQVTAGLLAGGTSGALSGVPAGTPNLLLHVDDGSAPSSPTPSPSAAPSATAPPGAPPTASPTSSPTTPPTPSPTAGPTASPTAPTASPRPTPAPHRGACRLSLRKATTASGTSYRTRKPGRHYGCLQGSSDVSLTLFRSSATGWHRVATASGEDEVSVVYSGRAGRYRWLADGADGVTLRYRHPA